MASDYDTASGTPRLSQVEKTLDADMRQMWANQYSLTTNFAVIGKHIRPSWGKLDIEHLKQLKSQGRRYEG